MDKMDEIADPEKWANEISRLYTEMGEDKTMKKLRDKVKEKGLDIAGIIID